MRIDILELGWKHYIRLFVWLQITPTWICVCVEPQIQIQIAHSISYILYLTTRSSSSLSSILHLLSTHFPLFTLFRPTPSTLRVFLSPFLTPSLSILPLLSTSWIKSSPQQPTYTTTSTTTWHPSTLARTKSPTATSASKSQMKWSLNHFESHDSCPHTSRLIYSTQISTQEVCDFANVYELLANNFKNGQNHVFRFLRTIFPMTLNRSLMKRTKSKRKMVTRRRLREWVSHSWLPTHISKR